MSEVVILTGPPGAGKSSVGEAYAKQAMGTWAYIDQDKVRQQVKAGFKNPSDPWDDETQKQWDVSIELCGDIAREYQQNGINCLIDCFMPPHALEKWKTAFTGVNYRIIVILPSVNVALERNNKRRGEALLRDSQVRQHHEWFTGYIDDKQATILDTSDLSIDEAVSSLTDALKSHL